MLDPLTALGLAANLIQFIDFLNKIVSHSRDIRLGDSTREQQDARRVAEDAVKLSKRLAGATNVPAPSQDDSNLLTLSDACVTAAEDIIEALTQIAAPPSYDVKSAVWKQLLDSLGRWKTGVTMYKALKAIMGKEKIDRLRQRLVEFQTQLDRHVLVDIRESIKLENVLNDRRFGDLDANIQCIMKTILTQKDDIFDQIEGHFGSMHVRHDRSDALVRQFRDELMSELKKSSQEFVQPGNGRHNALPLCSEQRNVRRLEESILHHLSYRGMEDRQFLIAESHADTFRWALRDDTHPKARWSNLIKWLRDGSGFYWINGKAASGKSTFMKFVTSQKEIRTALCQWAQKDRHAKLLMDEFYFWHLGSAFDRSQEALLRSLLRSVLNRYSALIAQVLPGYWNELLQSMQNPEAEPPQRLSSAEIKIAFIKAMSSLPPEARICFFIDGLDEYSGDHLEMCEFLKRVIGPQVKMVISSRPLRTFSVFFAEFPGLCLQYLTRGDIENYVSGELCKSPAMRSPSQTKSSEIAALAGEVVSRSAGVFLWVILVVKALVRELNNFSSLDELRLRLEEYPEELDDLYRHIMDQLDPLYRYQASSYLQIVQQATSTQESWPLTLDQMYFAAVKDPTEILIQSHGFLNPDELASYAEEMEARLASRCCGLIEAIPRTEALKNRQSRPRARLSDVCNSEEVNLLTLKPSSDFEVMFLHKSVADFLEKAETWRYLTELTKQPPAGSPRDFNVNFLLMSSCLSIIKAYPMEMPPPAGFQETAYYDIDPNERKWFRHRSMVLRVQQYADRVNDSVSPSRGIFKKQAYRTMEQYLTQRPITDDWNNYDITKVFKRTEAAAVKQRHFLDSLVTWPC